MLRPVVPTSDFMLSPSRANSKASDGPPSGVSKFEPDSVKRRARASVGRAKVCVTWLVTLAFSFSVRTPFSTTLLPVNVQPKPASFGLALLKLPLTMSTCKVPVSIGLFAMSVAVESAVVWVCVVLDVPSEMPIICVADRSPGCWRTRSRIAPSSSVGSRRVPGDNRSFIRSLG